jgi:hypothetical protein
MDVGRRAAYFCGLVAATARTTASRVVSRAAPVAGETGVEASSFVEKTTTWWQTITYPFRHVIFGLVLPFIWWILRSTIVVLAFAAALLLLFILVVNSARIGRWLQTKGEGFRERYDDFALNNHFLLGMEHMWGSFKRAMYDLYLTLRYNETTDKIVRLGNEIYFLPDTVQRFLARHWAKLVLACLFFASLRWICCTNRVVEVPFHMLPAHLTKDQPQWVTNYWLVKKPEGSNNHHIRQPELPPPVKYEAWVQAVGGDQSVSVESFTTTETLTVEKEPLTRTVETEPLTTTMTETLTKTTTHISTRTESSAESPTDYWAPPKKRTILEEPGMVYCRECQQWHCCELPY